MDSITYVQKLYMAISNSPEEKGNANGNSNPTIVKCTGKTYTLFVYISLAVLEKK